jgi:hypothetical protein
VAPRLNEEDARHGWRRCALSVEENGGFRLVHGEEEAHDIGARLGELLHGASEALLFFGCSDGGRAVHAEREKLGGVSEAAAGKFNAAEVARDGAPAGEVPRGAEGGGSFVELSGAGGLAGFDFKLLGALLRIGVGGAGGARGGGGEDEREAEQEEEEAGRFFHGAILYARRANFIGKTYDHPNDCTGGQIRSVVETNGSPGVLSLALGNTIGFDAHHADRLRSPR